MADEELSLDALDGVVRAWSLDDATIPSAGDGPPPRIGTDPACRRPAPARPGAGCRRGHVERGVTCVQTGVGWLLLSNRHRPLQLRSERP